MEILPLETRILLVEDSPIMASQTITVLRSMGYKNLVEARHGLEAIHHLVESRVSNVEFGLFILDWNMPKITGLEFFHMVKGIPEWAAVPVIFLTSSNGLENVVTAASAGVDHYLIKPATKENLEKKLNLIVKLNLKKKVDQLMMNPSSKKK